MRLNIPIGILYLPTFGQYILPQTQVYLALNFTRRATAGALIGGRTAASVCLVLLLGKHVCFFLQKRPETSIGPETPKD